MPESREIAIEEARELVSNELLWPRVRDFLYDFAPQVHGSWIDNEKLGSLEVWKFGGSENGQTSKPQNLKTSKLQSLSSSARVKEFILGSLGVTPFFHTFPKDDGSRLALLDGATLESVVKWLGALALADELRRVTDGATVRALKAALPGVYPDVFGYVAYFGALGGESLGGAVVRSLGGEGGVADAVVSTGYGLLLASLANLPSSLVSRLKLKLPNHLAAQPTNEQTKNHLTTQRPNHLTAVLKLLKLKFPKDYALCCS